jgi:hypothetical protein
MILVKAPFMGVEVINYFYKAGAEMNVLLRFIVALAIDI